MPANLWSAEIITLLLRLWPSHSASQIGARFGKSRSAICGKVARLRRLGELPRNVEKIYQVPPRPPPAPARPAKRLRPPTPMVTPVPNDLFNGAAPPRLLMRPCSLLELDHRRCHWPLGDLHRIAESFCGARALDGLPYCRHHCQQAYYRGERHDGSKDRRRATRAP